MKNGAGVALISGGSRGLGQALVTALLVDHYAVATFSRSESAFIKECQANHPERFMWEQIDGVSVETVRQFVMKVAKRFNRIDVLINNAAVGIDGFLPLVQADDVGYALDLNLRAAIHLIRDCSRVMLRKRAGSIINISSVNAVRGHQGVSVYTATKSGLDGLTRSLAHELGPAGIRVNSVAPGFLDTDMTSTLTEQQRARIVKQTPLGRFCTVDDVVSAVRFLISPCASFVTGQVLVVDGGMTC